MSRDGGLYVLELNSMASLGQTGSYYTAAKTAGYTYDSLINKILDVAAVRYFGESYLPHHPEQGQKKAATARSLRSVVRSYLRSHQTTNETLLEYMVNVNSSVYNVEMVNKLGNTITRRLKHLGFEPRVYKEFDVGDTTYYTNHGHAENDVLLLSHLDTWYSNQDFSAFRRIGGKLYGSGIAESKGGLVVMLSALQALRFARRLKNARCGILLVGDDSIGGRFSKKMVRDTAGASRYVIDLKWGMENAAVATSCSGTIKYHVDMVHIRRPDETVKDVIPEMCKRIVDWKNVTSAHDDARVTIPEFQARTSFGMSPDYGGLTITSRFVTRQQGEEIGAELHRIAKKKGKAKLDIHIIQQSRRNPVEKTKEILEFYEMVERLAREADVKIAQGHRYASSSLGDVQGDGGKPVLGSMGPIGIDYRTPNEHIIRDSIVDRALLLALTINKIASVRGGDRC